MTPRERIDQMARSFGYTLDEIRGPSRKKPIVNARAAIARHLRLNGCSQEHIGRTINRERTSVLNLIRRAS